MAYNSRSGARVSEYRKNSLMVGGTLTTATNSHADIIPIVVDSDKVNQVKHIRGFVSLGFTNSGSNNQARGFIGLVRYPRLEALTNADLKLDASWFLHPVPWALIEYPQTIPYEHVGVTVGPEEALYLIVWAQFLNVNMYLQTALIYDVRMTPV